MKVTWHPEATKGRRQIVSYIRRRFGIKYVKDFRQEVDQTVKLLSCSPNIGSIDPLFSNRSKTYRSLIINGLSKMVYFVENDTIYIAAFWDTRMEPQAQASKIK